VGDVVAGGLRDVGEFVAEGCSSAVVVVVVVKVMGPPYANGLVAVGLVLVAYRVGSPA
jgi:hypothetical protein